jgi:hypothetical protein
MGKKNYKQKHKYTYVEEIPEYYHNSKFNLRIDKSQIKDAGLGVFTSDFIPANTFIDYYKGNTCSGIKGGIYFFAIQPNCQIPFFCFYLFRNQNLNVQS